MTWGAIDRTEGRCAILKFRGLSSFTVNEMLLLLLLFGRILVQTG